MVYLDHAATSPLCEEALKEYVSASRGFFANPSSSHQEGRKASRELNRLRKDMLSLLQAEKTHELLFLSGATEANNMALKSVAFRYQGRGKKIISSSAEHPSVLNALKSLRDDFGFEVIFLPANEDGAISPKDLAEAIDKQTILVSVMAVNNETGAISPLREIASIVRGYPKCFLHVDATQAIGKEKVDLSLADLFTGSAHKFEGPKGVGFLAYRKNISFLPLLSGGAQEKGFRGGTEDLPSIAAMVAALRSVLSSQSANQAKIKEINGVLRAFLQRYPDLFVINSPANASSHILNFSLLRHKASVVLEGLSEKGIYVSSVSACSSKEEPVSHVLLSMGFDKARAGNAIRVSFSRASTLEEANAFSMALLELLKELKPL